MKLDELEINALAAKYVQTASNDDFYALYVATVKFLRYSAEAATVIARRTGVNIPSEDFESQFTEALWQATKGYDVTIGYFSKRLQFFMKRREVDVWRKYETKGGKSDKSGKRYEKARMDSLDRPVGDGTLSDIVKTVTPSAEEAYFNREALAQLERERAAAKGARKAKKRSNNDNDANEPEFTYTERGGKQDVHSLLVKWSVSEIVRKVRERYKREFPEQ